jgi:hypothetical protein
MSCTSGQVIIKGSSQGSIIKVNIKVQYQGSISRLNIKGSISSNIKEREKVMREKEVVLLLKEYGISVP